MRSQAVEICFNDITECINVSLSFPQNTIVAVVDNLVYEGLILSTEIGFAQLDQSLSTTVLWHFFLLHLERVCFIVQICLREKVNYIVAPYELHAQMAFLVNRGHANFALTEDSDLLA